MVEETVVNKKKIVIVMEVAGMFGTINIVDTETQTLWKSRIKAAPRNIHDNDPSVCGDCSVTVVFFFF